MYENIGHKIKILAKITFFFGIIAAISSGIALMVEFDDLIFLGLFTIIFGIFTACMLSWLIYGFGELIDKTSAIERNTRGGTRISEAQAKVDSVRMGKLEKLRTQGLISEAEYQQALLKEHQGVAL